MPTFPLGLENMKIFHTPDEVVINESEDFQKFRANNKESIFYANSRTGKVRAILMGSKEASLLDDYGGGRNSELSEEIQENDLADLYPIRFFKNKKEVS